MSAHLHGFKGCPCITARSALQPEHTQPYGERTETQGKNRDTIVLEFYDNVSLEQVIGYIIHILRFEVEIGCTKRHVLHKMIDCTNLEPFKIG
jgi:hypothetical protein